MFGVWMWFGIQWPGYSVSTSDSNVRIQTNYKTN